MRTWIALRLTLAVAGLLLAVFGCGHKDGAGSADPHHYTAAEARAAFQQRVQAAGPGPGRTPPEPAKPGTPPATPPGK